MILNTFAGRSYNDANQYPVFPWIVKDYKSPFIDFNTKDSAQQEKIFRDLSKPIGAQSDLKRSDAKEKYEDSIDERYHYGSHYSNSGYVVNFLVRLEPYTTQLIDLQNGRFDQADRLFNSIGGTWDSVFMHRGDFRELIPEFFYLPEFLVNW